MATKRNHPDTYLHTDPTPTTIIPIIGYCQCLCHKIGAYAVMNCRHCDHN